jgi:Ca-activated chloride channel family protein
VEFTWPVMLWGLLLLPAFVGWYAIGVRRARTHAVIRFAEQPLFERLATSLPAVRRHISMGFYFLALALLLAAVSRPVMAIPLPVNKAVVLLAVDTSGSMMAPDLAPSRLEAAKVAARTFVDVFPQGPKIGLVSFSTYATLMIPPTPDHEAVKQAIAGLKPQEATAIGDGIAVALKAIPGRVVDLPETQAGPGPLGPAQPPAVQPSPAPARPEDLPPAAIILISDGGQNAGSADPLKVALLAKQQRVKIYTIGLGTLGGSVFNYQGQMVFVPFNPALLQQVAAITDGRFFISGSAQELKQIYRELGRMIGWETRKTEVSSMVVGSAGLLLLVGGVISMLWTGRLP